MLRELLFGFLLIHYAVAKHGHPGKNKLVNPAGPVDPTPANPGPKKWLTLNGAPPVVVAGGGFPTLYPDSSDMGYIVAAAVPGIVFYCNLQLTKDNLGVCLPDMKLDNCTNAPAIFPKLKRKYIINGLDAEGWFSIDFNLGKKNEFDKILLIQNTYSRSSIFDEQFTVLPPESVFGMAEQVKTFWINVENEAFWNEHKLSAVRYLEDSVNYFVANYISSPEIAFLKAIGTTKAIDKTKTKLVFRFRNLDEVEPTTKEKYSSFLGKLPMIKTFASAILVPKNYIWPVAKDGYLLPPTTLVTDAHKEGLEVYTFGFASDAFSSYNYSFDPTNEYLHFVDNAQFSVDGVITESPVSANNVIACPAPDPIKKFVKALVITENGASVDFPGCTDLAYEKAITDGADIIDCNVQMTKDGVPFCLESVDLIGKTTAAVTLMDKSTSIPEIQPDDGIFSFDFTWSEIQSLKPMITSPFAGRGGLLRNPRLKNAGKLVTLPEFLDIAKRSKTTTGVLIGIKHAAYLASKKGLDIVETVAATLKKATLDPKQQVMIQSDDTSVLAKFKEINPSYQRVFWHDKLISDVPKPVIDAVKKHADAINVHKKSIIISNKIFMTTGYSKIVEEMHAANISVYVSGFSAESQSMQLDFYSDPYTDLKTYFRQMIDAVITDSPKTASSFIRNPCSDPDNVDLPYVYPEINAGDYFGVSESPFKPPAEPPYPQLQMADVADSPLPAVNVSAAANTSDSAPAGGDGASPPPKSSQPRMTVDINLSMAAAFLMIGFTLY